MFGFFFRSLGGLAFIICYLDPVFDRFIDLFSVITCPELKPPPNGYFVKKLECNNVLNNACGVRCKVGYTLEGDSIRLCQTNGTWSGRSPSCKGTIKIN